MLDEPLLHLNDRALNVHAHIYIGRVYDTYIDVSDISKF
jgi:hypothetical protein